MEDQFVLDKEGLKKILDLLEQQFGSHCEVVLHDLSGPYDSTIIDIRNGHITGRKVGDCGSDLGLEVIRGTVKNGDKFNYFTNTRDGKILRSSSVYFRDTEGKVRYCICVNVDITESIRFENYLHESNQYNIGIEDNHADEIFVNNVHDLLEEMLERGIQYVGNQPSEMNKENKMQLLEFLDKKGAFLISKSGEKICEVLGISKYTFYNYLETIRKGNGQT